ncbi:hypothetical protein T11_15336, partial [Trichinella zimbabwensis]
LSVIKCSIAPCLIYIDERNNNGNLSERSGKFQVCANGALQIVAKAEMLLIQ